MNYFIWTNAAEGDAFKRKLIHLDNIANFDLQKTKNNKPSFKSKKNKNKKNTI